MEFKNKKSILAALYIILIVVVVVSIFDTSIISQLDSDFVKEDISNIDALTNLIRTVNFVSYVPVIIIAVIGLVITFKSKSSKVSVVILAFAIVVFGVQVARHEEMILSESMSGEMDSLDVDVEMAYDNQVEGNSTNMSDYIYDLRDILF